MHQNENQCLIPNSCRLFGQDHASKQEPMHDPEQLQTTEEDDVSVQRIDANARMSKVVVHGDTVYLAGLTADKTVGQELAEQTREVLSLIDAFLAKAGTDKSKLLTATIWLSDIRTVGEMNKVW